MVAGDSKYEGYVRERNMALFESQPVLHEVYLGRWQIVQARVGQVAGRPGLQLHRNSLNHCNEIHVQYQLVFISSKLCFLHISLPLSRIVTDFQLNCAWGHCKTVCTKRSGVVFCLKCVLVRICKAFHQLPAEVLFAQLSVRVHWSLSHSFSGKQLSFHYFWVAPLSQVCFLIKCGVLGFWWC